MKNDFYEGPLQKKGRCKRAHLLPWTFSPLQSTEDSHYDQSTPPTKIRRSSPQWTTRIPPRTKHDDLPVRTPRRRIWRARGGWNICCFRGLQFLFRLYGSYKQKHSTAKAEKLIPYTCRWPRLTLHSQSTSLHHIPSWWWHLSIWLTVPTPRGTSRWQFSSDLVCYVCSRLSVYLNRNRCTLRLFGWKPHNQMQDP